MFRSKNYIATPPGETIKEQLIDRGMSQKEFASRMEMSEKHISRLINGEVQLTHDMAMRLEMVLGISASFWNNLETRYREKLALVNQENQMDEDIEIVKKLPFKEMVKNGWVNDCESNTGKVIECRKYFEVVRLGIINDRFIPSIACRRLSITEKSDIALIVWAQKAKIEARSIKTKPINLEKLQNSLSEIRSMTIESPRDFCPKLISILSECGVAMVFLPHIGGSFLHGATFIDKNKIIIGLTVRGKDADRFWFSLFHEIGHIIYGHIYNPNGTTEDDEKAADEFARDTLIKKEDFDEFLRADSFGKNSIIRFSTKIGIDPGIVVGRLQKEGKIKYSWHNDLKTKYEISA